jgi:hypothetical protein
MFELDYEGLMGAVRETLAAAMIVDPERPNWCGSSRCQEDHSNIVDLAMEKIEKTLVKQVKEGSIVAAMLPVNHDVGPLGSVSTPAEILTGMMILTIIRTYLDLGVIEFAELSTNTALTKARLRAEQSS